MVGAVIGAVIGLVLAVPGIILGSFLGALLFEMSSGRKFDDAARAGMGAVIGLVAGAAGKFATGMAMIVIFVVYVVTRSGGIA
jgi:uncharacterized protein YqgC (DUF456 family)